MPWVLLTVKRTNQLLGRRCCLRLWPHGWGKVWGPIKASWEALVQVMMCSTNCSVRHCRNLRAQWCTTLLMESRWDVCFVWKPQASNSSFALRPVGLEAGYINISIFLFSLHFRDQQRATPPTTRKKWKVGKVLKCFLPLFLFLFALSLSPI